MAESSMLFKIIVFLGLMMVFVNLLYPGANPAWANLEASVQNVPSLPTFPTFVNPNNNVWNSTIPFVEDGVVLPDSLANCASGKAYICLSDDNLSTQVVFHQTFTIQIRGFNTPSGIVGAIWTDVWCKNNAGHNTGLTFNYTLANGTIFYAQSKTPLCPPPGLAESSWAISPLAIPIQEFNGATLAIDTWGPVGQNHDSTSLASLTIRLFVQGPQPVATCAALDIGCAFWGAAQVALAPFVFFLNGVTYVVELIVSVAIFIGSIFVYIGTIMFNVLAGIVLSFIYFFTLPGAPTWVQAIIDVIMVACLVFVLVLLLDRAVGLFGGAVNKL